MLSPRTAPSKARGRALGPAFAVGGMALVVGVTALFALFAAGAPNAGAKTDREARVGRVAHVSKATAAALGAAVGQSALGLRSSYYQPAALADPSQPAIIDHTGWDEPDPFVFVQNGSYYLFTSSSNEPENVPVQSASAFGQWGPVTDALPDLPAWATASTMWAPDVAQFGNHYMLYWTSQTQHVTPSTKCIGDAISTNPAGPYIASPTPFICQTSLGGDIDPRVFVDGNGQAYMIWKSDQNSMPNGGPTQIWSQPLSADGTQLVGSPTVIFGPDESWQQSIVEAPQMELVQGTYYLFYSGGHFFEPSYGIGVARCTGPTGPCTDTSSMPLVASNLQGWGPGEESVFANGTGVWMIYSPWFANLSGNGPPRPIALARLGFGPAGPYLAAPYQNISTSAGTTAANRTP